jgi:hydroxypyruvate isomerase
MPVFAANLSMLFNEWDFLDRFDAAAEAGFSAVEFLFPYDHAPEAIAERLARNNLTLALFNLPPGNWDAGERGLAALPGREAEFDAGLARALPYVQATGVKRIHLMSGYADRTDPRCQLAFTRAVGLACERLGEGGVSVMLEPINHRDMPGYFNGDFAFAEAFIKDMALANLRLQFDIYHRQVLHGDVTTALRAMMPIIGHVQIASAPSRQEPDSEELNMPFLFAELDRLGYDGFVGAEYRPKGHTLDGLGWWAAERART